MKKIILLIISLLLVVGCGKDSTKELVCNKPHNETDTIVKQQVIATYNEDKLENIEMTVSTRIPSESLATTYMNTLKESEMANYKGTDSVSVDTKAEGDIVSVITNINYRTFTEKDASIIAIGKDAKYEDLKTRFEKIGYVCE